jgi:hypothetical protein
MVVLDEELDEDLDEDLNEGLAGGEGSAIGTGRANRFCSGNPHAGNANQRIIYHAELQQVAACWIIKSS